MRSAASRGNEQDLNSGIYYVRNFRLPKSIIVWSVDCEFVAERVVAVVVRGMEKVESLIARRQATWSSSGARAHRRR